MTVMHLRSTWTAATIRILLQQAQALGDFDGDGNTDVLLAQIPRCGTRTC
jgi:hypothetical protein